MDTFGNSELIKNILGSYLDERKVLFSSLVTNLEPKRRPRFDKRLISFYFLVG